MYIDWWWALYQESPWHVAIETGLILFILWVVFFKKQYNPEKKGFGARDPDELTEKEKQELIDEWEPIALVPPMENDAVEVWSKRVTVERQVSTTHVQIEGDPQPKLNMTSNDFLGFANSASVKEVAKAAMDEYTLGSCGPRGFYGTTKLHLDLEGAIAQFMGTSEAICYSDAVSCVASGIPAFSKRGDLLIIDDGVNHALRTGTILSRSTALWFKHNDMDDLERVLKGAVRRFSDKAKTQRRFIVFEGLYKNSGDIAKLRHLVQLGAKYKFRLMADESLSWGVLGDNGRGVTEHFNLPVTAIDVIIASMSASLGSVGGFCVGNREVTDHQRLAGAGYCFSASAPPFLCATAQHALENMTPKKLKTLATRCKQLSRGMQRLRRFKVVSAEASPVLHARLANVEEMSTEEQNALLDQVAEECLERGVLVSRSCFLPEMETRTAPTLRLHVSAAMSKADVARALEAVEAATTEVFGDAGASGGKQEEDEDSEQEAVEAPAAGSRSRKRNTGKRGKRTATRAAAASTPAQGTRRRSNRLSAKRPR